MHGLMKEVRVSLTTNKDIYVLVDIIVIDVINVRGMLLSRKCCASIGGQLQMDWSYATIPTIDGKPFILYSGPHMPEHVEDIKPFQFPRNLGKAKLNAPPLNLQVEWKHFEPKLLERPRQVETMSMNVYQGKTMHVTKGKRQT